MPERPYVPTFLDERRFTHTKNPVYVIKAFIEAHEQKKYPPKWAQDFVAKKFKEFDASHGKKELNKLFGFNKGKGQSPSYKKYFTEKRYKILCMDVFKLVYLFKMSIIDASHLVAIRLQETSDYKMPFKLKYLSEKTIETKYNKRWGRKFNNSSTLKEHLDSTSPKDMLKFLNMFDKDLVDTYKRTYSNIRRALITYPR